MKKAGLIANWRQGSNLVKMQVSVMLFTEKKCMWPIFLFWTSVDMAILRKKLFTLYR
jgi:hypothetical protein